MFHSILAHFSAHGKSEAIAVTILAGLGGIGLMANGDTSPKVLAVMVFLSDWNMLWTWEWWLRMIICLALYAVMWWFQKQKHEKELSIWSSKVATLQGELRQSDILITGLRTQLAVLEGK